MEYSQSHDWHQEFRAGDVFTTGSYWPSQYWKQTPTPPPPSLRVPRMPLSPRPENNFSTKAITHKYNTRAMTIPNPTLKSKRIEENLKKFQDFHSGRGAFQFSPGEQALTLKITKEEFLGLKKLLHDDEEEGSPEYSYHASSGTLITEYSPSPLHEGVVSTLLEGFILPRARLPPSIKSKIRVVRNQKFIDFTGVHQGSEKVPDLALLATSDKGIDELKFVVEVGLSETYEQLAADAKLWLEGTKTVSLVLLVKLRESPAYRSPIMHLTDDEITGLGFPNLSEIKSEPFTVGGSYGPAVYKGLVWMGKISGFLESWKLDPHTKLAIPTSHIDLYEIRDSPNSGLWLSHLMDIDDQHDDEICFDWKNFLDSVQGCIRQTAINRCYRSVRDAIKRANPLDSDYQPSSPMDSE